MMKYKNIILGIIITILLCSCYPINRTHNNKKSNVLYVYKTEDDIDKVKGFGRCEYNYKISKNEKVTVCIEMYEKGKLLKKEAIEKNINEESNKETIELSINKDEKNNIIWGIRNGERGTSFTTENYIDKCKKELINISSESYVNNNKAVTLVQYKGNYNDQVDSKNEKVKNKDQILNNYDFVFFLTIDYEA